MEEVEKGTHVSNGICFSKSIVEKVFASIPQEVTLFWKPFLGSTGKPIGFARWDSGTLVAIYMIIHTQQIRSCLFKFSYLDGVFAFDSIYTSYDIDTKVNIYPYENRYNATLDIIAVYKFEEVKVDGKEYTLNYQYKNNKKTKEYYKTREHASILCLQDLIDIDGIEYDKRIQTIHLHQFKVRELPNISYYFID